jgi:hypothetical protein
MKKIITLTFVGLLITTFLISCGSSKKGNCDAYGQKEALNKSDLASK